MMAPKCKHCLHYDNPLLDEPCRSCNKGFLSTGQKTGFEPNYKDSAERTLRPLVTKLRECRSFNYALLLRAADVIVALARELGETRSALRSVTEADDQDPETDEPDDADLEMGFDPYLGCYTDDC